MLIRLFLGMWEILQNLPLPSFYHVGMTVFQKFFRMIMTEQVSDLIYHDAVCRTALATKGLLTKSRPKRCCTISSPFLAVVNLGCNYIVSRFGPLLGGAH